MEGTTTVGGQRWAILLAFVLGVLFLGPTLLPGRALLPQDVRAFEPFRSTLSITEVAELDAVAVPHRRDKLLQFLPYDSAVSQAWRSGRVPLWEPRILGGLPLLAQGTSRALYPTALLFALASPAALYAWTYLLHLVLGGLFLYRLARRFGASEAGAQLGNAAFVLSGYVVGHVHHPMIFFAAVWTLPALELTHALLRDHLPVPLRQTAYLAAVTSFSWLAGFAQASVLLGYLVAGLTLYLLVEDRVLRRPVPWRRAVLVGCGLLLGVSLAAAQILPTLEMARHSARAPADLDVLREHALAPVHLLELLLPGQLAAAGDLCPQGPELPRPSYLALLVTPLAKAGALTRGAFNHTETALAFGIWPLFFAVLSLGMLRRVGHRAVPLFLWTATLIGVLAALAMPGIVHVLVLLPGFTVGDLKRILLLPAICLPLLAAIGWRQPSFERRAPWLFLGGASLLLGAAVSLVSAEVFETAAARALAWRYGGGVTSTDVQAALLPGESGLNQVLLGRGLLLLGFSLLVPPLLARWRGLGVAPFVILTVLELLPVAAATSPAPRRASLDAALPPSMTPATGAPLRLLRLEPRRGASAGDVRLLPPNLPLLFGLADAAGYAPLPPARTEAFFERIEPGVVSRGAGLGALRDPASLRSPLLPLLALDRLLTTEIAAPGFVPVGGTSAARLYAPAEPQPRVRLFFSHEVFAEAEAEDALTRQGFDPLTSLVLEEEPSPPPGPTDPNAEATLLSAAPGSIRVHTRSRSPALLFVSESWAEGWSATIDAQDAGPTLPAHVMFQAIPVPAGEHEITLRYAPRSFAIGAVVSLLSLLAWLGLIGLSVGLKRRTAVSSLDRRSYET